MVGILLSNSTALFFILSLFPHCGESTHLFVYVLICTYELPGKSVEENQDITVPILSKLYDNYKIT